MNEHIATGHMMRCLSIAEAAREMKIDVSFVISDQGAEQFIKNKGFQTITLNSKWDDMEAELPTIFEKINFSQNDKLIVDSYYVTEKYLKKLKEKVYTAYIEDIGDKVYDVDCIICYACYADELDFENRYPKETKLLLGTKYVPLRKEFRNLPEKKIKENIENLLIMCGGADPYGFIKQLLEKIDNLRYKKVDVICGRYNKDYQYLSQKYQKYNNVNIIQSVDNIIDYMIDADLAISAAGSTLYELCATGTPTISYVLAENQVKNAERFDINNFIPYAESVSKNSINIIINEIISIMASEMKELNRRRYHSEHIRLFVDGYGARRIVETL